MTLALAVHLDTGDASLPGPSVTLGAPRFTHPHLVNDGSRCWLNAACQLWLGIPEVWDWFKSMCSMRVWNEPTY